jgi:hypothetical protein
VHPVYSLSSAVADVDESACPGAAAGNMSSRCQRNETMWKLAGPALLFLLAACSSGSGKSAKLTLDDPYWERVNVEAVITNNTDCNDRGPGYVATKEFTMTKGHTYSVVAPNAEMICWRRDRDPNNPVKGDWSDWSRATMFPGQSVETDL